MVNGISPDATAGELRQAYPSVKAAVFRAIDPAEAVVMRTVLDDGLELLSEYAPSALPAVVLMSASLRALIILYDIHS